jgi:predicted metal-dependent peptidase
MDIAVNQFIKGLPAWSEKIENVRLSYNIELKDNDTIESYAYTIQESINSRKKSTTTKDTRVDKSNEYSESEMSEELHNIINEHTIWNSSSLESDPKQYNEAVKKIINSSVRGEMPFSMQELIKKYNTKSELSWKYYLKSMLGKISGEYKKTSVRRDRRQPERYDIRGRLRSHRVNIIIAIDISGSISDQEIEKIMKEVFVIVKVHNVKTTIIECDSEIRRIYSVKKPKDLLGKINTRGGTKYTPVFEYMSKNESSNSILIYFTDGLGENEMQVKETHRNTIWVLTGQEQELSLKSPPGVVLKLSNGKKKEMNILALEYLKNEMKEIRSEWAK